MNLFNLWRPVMMFSGGTFLAVGMTFLPYWSGLAGMGFFMVLFGPILICMSLLKTKDVKTKETLMDEKNDGAPFR